MNINPVRNNTIKDRSMESFGAKNGVSGTSLR